MCAFFILRKQVTHTLTHTCSHIQIQLQAKNHALLGRENIQMHIYTYIYVYVCIFVCMFVVYLHESELRNSQPSSLHQEADYMAVMYVLEDWRKFLIQGCSSRVKLQCCTL